MSWKQLKYGLKAQKTTAQGNALGTCTYTRMALWKSKRWNLECFVASSFSLAERHHTYSLLPKAVALDYGLLDFQPVL